MAFSGRSGKTLGGFGSLGTPKLPNWDRALLGPSDAAITASEEVLGSFGEIGEGPRLFVSLGRDKMTDEREVYLKVTEKEKKLCEHAYAKAPPRSRVIRHFIVSNRCCLTRRRTGEEVCALLRLSAIGE